MSEMTQFSNPPAPNGYRAPQLHVEEDSFPLSQPSGSEAVSPGVERFGQDLRQSR